jgi:hypothetical protein
MGNIFAIDETSGSGVLLYSAIAVLLSTVLQSFDRSRPFISLAIVYVLTRPIGASATSVLHVATANSFLCSIALLAAILAAQLLTVQTRSIEELETAQGSDAL